MPYNEVKVHSVPMSDIYSDSSRSNETDLIELAEDVEKQGLVNPIVVEPYNGPNGEHYRIIEGNQRYKAHKLNKQSHIDCIVRLENN